MNIVKILLVLGLGYVALNQKVEKTRNMLLVVTGLLAFCMFSMEGFTGITFTAGANGGSPDTANAQFSSSGAGATAVAADGVLITGGRITSSRADGRVYTFPVGFNVSTGAGNVDYTCGTNEVKGDMVNSQVGLSESTVAQALPCVSKQLCSAAPNTLTCSSGTKKSGAADYCAGSTCASSDFGAAPTNCCAPNETCGAGKTRLPAKCPGNYKDKANTSCPNLRCVAADFTSSGACCELPCSDDKCHWYNLFGDGDDCGWISKCDE